METLKGSNEGSSLSFVDQVNRRLEVLYGQLNSTALPDFGSDMLLCSTDSIVATTVAHRFLKKFQKPDVGARDHLHEACVSEWLAQEASFSTFSWANVPLRSKSVLYRARELIKKWTAEFRRSSEVSFTPGESFIPSYGKVSVYQKLRNKDAWTVTHDAFEDFARLVYNTRWLKKVAKSHFHTLSREQYRRVYDSFKGSPHVGYAVFKHRFEHEVVTLIRGGRFESIYKDNSKNRPIIVGPTGNMLLQRTVAFPLRDIMRGVGNDLECGQDVHMRRIADTTVSTIDFSNASDSNLLKVVVELFPSAIHRLLRRYRDPFVLVGDCYYIPEKLSSMGCGFTFEVMTMMLLAIARVLDPDATVYGDDVIIKNEHAAEFQSVMGDIMWKVNNKKTFTCSRFRESCGAFYCDGYGYITCFDFRWCENANDAMIAINKLKMISDSNIPIIGGLFRAAHEDLLRIVPALSLGPVPHAMQPDLGYVACENAVRIQRRSGSVKKIWMRVKSRVDEICERFCLDGNNVCITARPKFVNTEASRTSRHIKSSPARVAFYLYNNLVCRDSIRFKGEWRDALYVVTSDACIPINVTENELKRWSTINENFEKILLVRYLLWSTIWSCSYLSTQTRRKVNYALLGECLA